MKILFIAGLIPTEIRSTVESFSKVSLQNAPNVFQWAIVKGLSKNSVDFSVVSFPYLPCWPLHFKKMYPPQSAITFGGKCVGQSYTYNTTVGIKMISVQRRLYHVLCQWIEENATGEKVILLAYNPRSAALRAMTKAKKRYGNVEICTIITDLVDDMMNYSSNRKPLKRMQCKIENNRVKSLYRHIDKFVLLTRHMEERIQESRGRNIVVEGIFGGDEWPQTDTNKKMNTFLYTGALEEFTGVRNMVDAFMMVRNRDCELWICGDGVCAEYVKEKSKTDSRIKFFGVVERKEALRLQGKARFLINPRQPAGSITRYSFPSKTMEYMASGTPMIGYRLDGIPDEYYQYMYVVEDLSVAGLTNSMEYCLDLPQAECDRWGMEAQRFILSEKTSSHQVKRIIDFIE